MTAYGPTKKEKLDLAWDLVTIIAGAASTTAFTVSAFVENPVMAWSLLIAVPLTVIGILLLFNEIEQVCIRIRLEESAAKSALIEEITAIYREEKR